MSLPHHRKSHGAAEPLYSQSIYALGRGAHVYGLVVGGDGTLLYYLPQHITDCILPSCLLAGLQCECASVGIGIEAEVGIVDSGYA